MTAESGRAELAGDAVCSTTSFEEAVEVLVDSTRFSSADVLKGRPSVRNEARQLLEREGLPYVRTLIDNDPPDHERFRRLIAPFFGADRVQSVRPRIRDLVDQRIAACTSAGRMELVADLAGPLPLEVIESVMGFEHGRSGDLKRWCDDWMILQSGTSPEAELVRCAHSYLALQTYVTACLEQHDPTADDLLGALVRAHREGTLTQVEMARLAMGVLAAGHETTTLGITNTVVVLLRSRDLWRHVQDPRARRVLIEEALRLEPPVRRLFRRVRATGSLSGRAVDAGDRVAVDYAAANRDPARMGPAADEVAVPSRRPAHLSFGRGVHACPGASLARTEITAVIDALAELRDLVIAGEPRRRDGQVSLQGWDEVHLHWRPG